MNYIQSSVSQIHKVEDLPAPLKRWLSPRRQVSQRIEKLRTVEDAITIKILIDKTALIHPIGNSIHLFGADDCPPPLVMAELLLTIICLIRFVL